MINMEKLGRDFWSVRFLLDVAHQNIALDDRISDEDVEDYMAELNAAMEGLKAISDEIAKESPSFCNGYVAANRKACEEGRRWSDERAEKIALLRLSGDDTPEEQIPI